MSGVQRTRNVDMPRQIGVAGGAATFGGSVGGAATFDTEMVTPMPRLPVEPSVAPPFPPAGGEMPDMWATVLGLRLQCCGKSMGMKSTKRLMAAMVGVMVLLLVSVIVLSVRQAGGGSQTTVMLDAAQDKGCAQYPPACLHGGTCTEDGVAGIICSCPPGYVGIACEVDVDACQSRPCLNDAGCVDGVEVYRCECMGGYAGVNCEFNVVDECASHPCMNNGVCEDLHTRYLCNCDVGFTGGDCEQDICESMPCSNGGSCVGERGSYGCDCPPGFAGGECEVSVSTCDETQRHTCDPLHSECISTAGGPRGSHTCRCHEGYRSDNAGRTCTVLNECARDPAPCRHGGACTNEVGGFLCTCAGGYYGEKCQHDIDDCASEPCAHGGTCVDSAGFYRCECAIGYTGTECEANLINECTGTPCQNGGRCVDQVGGFECECSTGWAGQQCEVSTGDGFGTEVDMANPFMSDGSYKLKFAPIFSGAMRTSVVMEDTRGSTTTATHVWQDVQSMLQTEAFENFGVHKQPGMFSADSYVASLRQRSYSARPRAALGCSNLQYTTATRSFGEHMELDPTFASAIAALPVELGSSAAMDSYFLFIRRYGTHYVARERFGGQVEARFTMYTNGIDYAAVEAAVAAELHTILESGEVTASQQERKVLRLGAGNSTVLLHGYTVAVVGGVSGAAPGGGVNWQAWTSSLADSAAASPEVIGLELRPISDLLITGRSADLRRGVLLAQAVGQYFGRCNGTAACSDRGMCNQLLGTCLCDTGFYGTDCQLASCPTGVLQTECTGQGSCNTVTGGCQCDEGFQGSDCATDFDECSLQDNVCAMMNTQCLNDAGGSPGYHCGDCANGYQVDPNCATGGLCSGSGGCVDIDECADANNECAALSVECRNLPGTYECGGCDDGYQPRGVFDQSGDLHCVDINECIVENSALNTCPLENKICLNDIGGFPGYHCGDCLNGFELDPTDGSCGDVDECEDPTQQFCADHSTCTNTIGGYSCHCNPGYQPTVAGGGGDTALVTDGSVCEASTCTSTTTGIDHAAPFDCAGSTGDVCEYQCTDGFYATGPHLCGLNGLFDGGGCALECSVRNLFGRFYSARTCACADCPNAGCGSACFVAAVRPGAGRLCAHCKRGLHAGRAMAESQTALHKCPWAPPVLVD